MSNHSSSYQDRYFYGSTWSKKVTTFLVEGLVDENNAGNWNWNGQNTLTISNIRNRINAHFNINFDQAMVNHRVRGIQNWFHIFDEMICRSDVEWDEENNIVYASPHTWDVLRHVYTYQGDPLYDSMKLLSNPPKQEDIEDLDDAYHPSYDEPPPTTNSVSCFRIPAPIPRPPIFHSSATMDPEIETDVALLANFGLIVELMRRRADIYPSRNHSRTSCHFFSVLSHHKKNRVVKHDFRRSGYTISKNFNSVLNTLLKLHTVLLVSLVPVPEGCDDYRWKYFKTKLSPRKHGLLGGTTWLKRCLLLIQEWMKEGNERLRQGPVGCEHLLKKRNWCMH
ncbi:hypothetical protein ACS0TY_011207 [Phlomoides rotata]